MSDVKGRLRITEYIIKVDGKKKIISVNRNPRLNVGYRATIRGQAGLWCDSENSPEEAVGKLVIEHFMGVKRQ